MSKYLRVSYELRCQISAFLQANLSVPEIARRMGFHKSTIYREVKRNSRPWFGETRYQAQHAEILAKKRFKKCRKPMAVTPEMEPIVIEKLWLCWSPEQIANRLKLEFGFKICHQSIYRFIENNPQHGIHLKFYKKRGAGRYLQRRTRPKWFRSIHERSQIVEQRKHIGDWERDCMYIADRRQILVITDRKTNFTKLCQLEKIDSKTVADETKKLLESTGKKIFTVTNDNGSEFRGKVDIKAPIFFCDPMKPQQRRTVENRIGDLRRYLTRKTKAGEIELQIVENIINDNLARNLVT